MHKCCAAVGGALALFGILWYFVRGLDLKTTDHFHIRGNSTSSSELQSIVKQEFTVSVSFIQFGRNNTFSFLMEDFTAVISYKCPSTTFFSYFKTKI